MQLVGVLAQLAGERLEMGGVGDLEFEDLRNVVYADDSPGQADGPAKVTDHDLGVLTFMAMSATWYVIEVFIVTPVTKMFLTSRMPMWSSLS